MFSFHLAYSASSNFALTFMQLLKSFMWILLILILIAGGLTDFLFVLGSTTFVLHENYLNFTNHFLILSMSVSICSVRKDLFWIDNVLKLYWIWMQVQGLRCSLLYLRSKHFNWESIEIIANLERGLNLSMFISLFWWVPGSCCFVCVGCMVSQRVNFTNFI